MKTKYTLYGGPLDGLSMSFDEELLAGDEFEVPVELATITPTAETTVTSAVLTIKYSDIIAVYRMHSSPAEPRYLKTKLIQQK